MFGGRHFQSQEKPRLRLTDLNSDVIANILSFLKPQHVISVRQTCRTLSIVTRTRSVWLNTLRTLMDACSITEDTFPLVSMSLSSLEYAALAPSRFIEVLKARPGNVALPPTQIRILPSRLTLKEQSVYGVRGSKNHDFRVAPGGRYLIVCSEHCSVGQGNGPITYVFTLWDIAIRQESEMKSLGRMTWPCKDCWLQDLYFKTTGLVYFVFQCKDFHGLQKIYVHRILLSPSSAIFEPCFERSIPTDSNFVVSRGLNWLAGYYIAANESTFVLWDFVEGKGVSWTSFDCSFAEDVQVGLYPFQKTLIATSGANDIMVYNVPEMEPLSPTHCRHLTLSASLVIPNPLTASESEIRGVYTHNAFNMSQYNYQRPYFCVSNYNKVFFYQIKDLMSLSDSVVPKNLPVNLGHFPLSNYMRSFNHFDFLDNMDDEHLLLGHNHRYWDMLSVFVFDLDSHGKPVGIGEGPSVEKSARDGNVLGFMDMKMMHVCSASGRFFFLTEAGMPTIQIFDYLQSPE